MTWNYQIFKFTTHDWEGNELASSRKGAPLYGLFEVYKNSKGEIHARTQSPELMIDSYGEETDDPVTLFKEQLTLMLQDIERPILEEPYPYADSEAMTEEEAQAFMAECTSSHGSGEDEHGKI